MPFCLSRSLSLSILIRVIDYRNKRVYFQWNPSVSVFNRTFLLPVSLLLFYLRRFIVRLTSNDVIHVTASDI